MLRVPFRLLAAAAFTTVGVMHFSHTHVFVGIMPPYIPQALHVPSVILSGVAEVAGGLGLLLPATRKAAGWGLLALLLAVFPANLHMALNNVGIGGMEPSPIALWLRLPLQGVIAAWVWWVAELGRRGQESRSRKSA